MIEVLIEIGILVALYVPCAWCIKRTFVEGPSMRARKKERVRETTVRRIAPKAVVPYYDESGDVAAVQFLQQFMQEQAVCLAPMELAA